MRVDANEDQAFGPRMVNPRLQAEIGADNDQCASLGKATAEGADRYATKMGDERTWCVATQGGGDPGLPQGIREIEGQFDQGDAVTICTLGGQKLAIGLSKYSAHDTRLIAGRKSHEFHNLLGYTSSDEFIHRDDLALLE